MRMWKKALLLVGIGLVVLFVSVRFAIVYGGAIRHWVFMERWSDRGVEFVVPPQPALADSENFLQAPGIVDWVHHEKEEGSGFVEVKTKPAALVAVDQFAALQVDRGSYSRSEARISAPEVDADVETILQTFAETDEVMEQLYHAVHRQDTEKHGLFSMGQLNDFQKYLSYRAYYQVEHGDRELGQRDFTTAITAIRLPIRIGDSMPSLISLLVELAMLGIVSDALWASLQGDNWDAKSLYELEAECRRIQVTHTMTQRVQAWIAWEDRDRLAEAAADESDAFTAWKLKSIMKHHLTTSHHLFAENWMWDPAQQKLLTEFDANAVQRSEDHSLALRELPIFIKVFTCLSVPNMGKIGDRIIEVAVL